MAPMGLLVALMEPEAAIADEFDDWYDSEHIPHMSGIQGILSAQRFVTVEGWPRYAALYDLDSAAVLTSASYRRVTGANFSPWSRRILRRVRGWRRLAFEQVEPGRSALLASSGALGILLTESEDDLEKVREAIDSAPATLQSRTYRPAAAEGPFAVVWEAGALAGLTLPSEVPLTSSWSARLLRYSRRDPAAAFARLESSGSA